MSLDCRMSAVCNRAGAVAPVSVAVGLGPNKRPSTGALGLLKKPANAENFYGCSRPLLSCRAQEEDVAKRASGTSSMFSESSSAAIACLSAILVLASPPPAAEASRRQVTDSGYTSVAEIICQNYMATHPEARPGPRVPITLPPLATTTAAALELLYQGEPSPPAAPASPALPEAPANSPMPVADLALVEVFVPISADVILSPAAGSYAAAVSSPDVPIATPSMDAPAAAAAEQAVAPAPVADAADVTTAASIAEAAPAAAPAEAAAPPAPEASASEVDLTASTPVADPPATEAATTVDITASSSTFGLATADPPAPPADPPAPPAVGPVAMTSTSGFNPGPLLACVFDAPTPGVSPATAAEAAMGNVAMAPQQGGLSGVALSVPVAGGGAVRLPLMALSAQAPPWWAQLGALVMANVLGLQAVLGVMKRLGDRAEPLTLVKLQLGLVHPPNAKGGDQLKKLRSRLGQLTDMIQVGQRGLWVIVEEALLELSQHHDSAALADVTVVHLESKLEAYDLFSEVAKYESDKAKAEEGLAHQEGEGTCVADWDGVAPEPRQKTLLQWLAAQPDITESGCDDALVVTVVVAARGHLDVPASVSSWADLCSTMKALCGLSSDRLMAVDLTWSPSTDGTYLTRDMLLQDFKNLKPLKP